MVKIHSEFTKTQAKYDVRKCFCTYFLLPRN